MAEKARSRASDGHFTEICFHMLSRTVQVNCAKYWDTESHPLFATSLLVHTVQCTALLDIPFYIMGLHTALGYT